MQSHDAEYRESGEGWARTPTPAAMTVPLSDTRLTEIRERVSFTVCPAAHPDEVVKDHVWVTGSLSGALRCSACSTPKSALDSDEAVLLAEVDRLRALVADYQGEVVRYDADHERLSAELSAWQSAQDAVMALTEDVNTPVTLAQVAKAHAHGLLAGRRAAAAKED